MYGWGGGGGGGVDGSGGGGGGGVWMDRGGGGGGGEVLRVGYVAKHMSLPYTLVFYRFDRISITQYNGRCQK